MGKVLNSAIFILMVSLSFFDWGWGADLQSIPFVTIFLLGGLVRQWPFVLGTALGRVGWNLLSLLIGLLFWVWFTFATFSDELGIFAGMLSMGAFYWAFPIGATKRAYVRYGLVWLLLSLAYLAWAFAGWPLPGQRGSIFIAITFMPIIVLQLVDTVGSFWEAKQHR